jgi:hypothetical protein
MSINYASETLTVAIPVPTARFTQLKDAFVWSQRQDARQIGADSAALQRLALEYIEEFINEKLVTVVQTEARRKREAAVAVDPAGEFDITRS